MWCCAREVLSSSPLQVLSEALKDRVEKMTRETEAQEGHKVAPSVIQGRRSLGLLFCFASLKKFFRKINLVAKFKIHRETLDLKMRVTQCRVYPQSMLGFSPSTKKETGMRDVHQEVHI